MSFLNIGQKFEKVMGKEVDLLEAARSGNIHTVGKLLSNKSRKSHVGGALGHKLSSFLSLNVNYTDKNGYTALHHAAVNGHRDVVEVLLRAEAQPGLPDNQGCNPVHLAAWNGDAEVVMQLLNAGAVSEDVHPVNVNQQNGTGDTALTCAAQYGHVAVVDVLLQKSAIPTIRNLSEASPLDLASQYGRLEVVQRLLISHPELARLPSSTQSPLHLASRNGHLDISAVLLDNNFDIQTVTETGNALHEAALHGKLDVVRLLLERGINVNQRDSKGQTVLELLSAHRAQQKSFTEITTAILDHLTSETDINQIDSGLYDNLASCHSGDKPTATVKPLPPEKPHPSDKPCPPEKPHSSAKPSPPDKPHPSDNLTLSEDKLVEKNRLMDRSPDDRPVPTPRMSIYHTSPDREPESLKVQMFSKSNKEQSDIYSKDSSIAGKRPPPLPPRSSVFPAEDLNSVQASKIAEANVVITAEKCPSATRANLTKPKKPPRQKRSPLPVRKASPTSEESDITSSPSTACGASPTSQESDVTSTPSRACGASPISQESDVTSTPITACRASPTSQESDVTSTPSTACRASPTSQESDITSTPSTAKPNNDIPHQTTNIPSSQNVQNDSANSNQSSQHSMQNIDQSCSTTSGIDQSDGSMSHSIHSSPPMKIPPPLKVPEEDNSVQAQACSKDSQGYYMDMRSVVQSNQTTRPVSAVKPQVKDSGKSASSQLQLTLQEMDTYGNLFPNLKKSVPQTSKKPYRRTNTAPEPDECDYVKPYPTSPTEKFKEKQGLLRRANTAPGESMCIPNAESKQGNDQKDAKLEEWLLSEINGKEGSLSPSSPKDNIYATITETSPVVDTDVYSQIKDLPSPVSSRNSEETIEEVPTDSPKPTNLDFLKKKPCGPLTPTGYLQPPTPDFPPPSPATAMMGIELKIQQIDSKRKSRDITTLTDDALENSQEQRSEVKATEEAAVVKVIEETSEVKDTGVRSEVIKTTSKNKELSDYQKETTESANLNVIQKIVATEEETAIKPDQSEVAKTYQSEAAKVDQSEASKTDKSESAKIDQSKTTKIDQSEVAKTYQSEAAKIDQSEASKTDKSESQSEAAITVIQSETKNIPESSIPNTVIETESENMLKNRPPVAKKPEVKSRSVKVKFAENDDKNSTTASGGSPVVLRRKTSTPEMNILKGLLRGSTVGSPSKVGTQFYNEVLRHSQARPRDPQPLSATMEKEDDIDIDQVMQSIDVAVAKQASHSEATSFDDTEEWEKIQDIMASFGGGIARESVFVRDLQPAFTKLLAGSGQLISIGEWLESIHMGQYENTFVANGYDNIDYLGPDILEEQDLEQIGVLSHEHRQKLLQAIQSLPLLKPIDPDDPPGSVEEWLMSLQLLDYLETFTIHGYDTMEKVQSILWELQLRTVLDISTLGHRKRLVASLGERKPLERHQKKRNISSHSPESPFSDIDLYKDYSNVKPVTSSEEDIKQSSQMAVDSSEDDDVFGKKKTTGQSIRNSNIHVRPPHLSQTSSPAKQWRHKPEMLIKGCCNYTAQYLGSTVVPQLTGGTESTRAGITKLKKSADILAKIPIILLSISYKGVKFIDAKSKHVICDHEIGNIFCACQDTDNLNFFAYITRDIQTGQHYCHVFSVKSASLAHDIILTLGESFEVAYQMALKERSNEEAMQLDRKMSQSDTEYTYSTVSKVSTNTV